jgi:hypothetical protein
MYRGDYGISEKQAVATEPFYGKSDEWMMVFCRSRKYPTRMARYARILSADGTRWIKHGLLVPTIPTGRCRPKGYMLMVKNTDFGQSIIQMGKWLREGTTQMAKRRAIGSFGVAMVCRKKARTTPFQARRCAPRHPRRSAHCCPSSASRPRENEGGKRAFPHLVR